MKYKKKVQRLESRRKDWEQTMNNGWKNDAQGAHKKPGSFNK